MANYLERVASSAGRRAAIAKPPVSGPPVLPAGRDFSVGPADPFASDEEQFLETLETHAPAPAEARTDIASTPKSEIREDATTTQDTTSVAPPEPKPNPRPIHERLSSESPFPVHIPRTLRPITTTNVPAPAPVEEAPRVRPSTPVTREVFSIDNEPTPVVNSTSSEESVTATTEAPGRRTPPAADSEVEHPVPKHTEVVLPDTTPIPRVARVDGPAASEPSPPPALPVHLPPAAGNSTRQEQSRIHIGSLEVLVNNHPRVTTARPAPAPSRSETLKLEKRYLDRFRLRH